MSLVHLLEELVECCDVAPALAELHRLWAVSPGLANASLINRTADKFNLPSRLQPSIHVLRSFTVEPILPVVKALGRLNGVEFRLSVGGFGTYGQEILDPLSALYTNRLDVAILAVQTRDLMPLAWDGFSEEHRNDAADQVENAVSTLVQLVAKFRDRSDIPLIVQNFEAPPQPAAGIFDADLAQGQAALVASANRSLRESLAGIPGIRLIDWDWIVAEYGRGRWYDEEKWETARFPISSAAVVRAAEAWVMSLFPTVGRCAKVLVLDLDNTLWGGVAGDSSISELVLGHTGKGRPHYQLQKLALQMQGRGLLLALVSKNNEEIAMEAFRDHPGMVLRPEHIAARRINWRPKAENLKELSQELKLGLDSFVFIDDNPAERLEMRLALPEVSVIELSSDPMEWPQQLRLHPMLQVQRQSTQEDANRTIYYDQQRQRAASAEAAEGRDAYLRNLRTVITPTVVTRATLTRAAQLLAKTNQFNTTSRRYGEQAVGQMIEDPAWHLPFLRVEDRFGDNGLVGLAVAKLGGAILHIDNLLLSCRVIGRDIETALLSILEEFALINGASAVIGEIVPTERNLPVQDVFERHGFASLGSGIWRLEVGSRQKISIPDWISVNPVQSA